MVSVGETRCVIVSGLTKFWGCLDFFGFSFFRQRAPGMSFAAMRSESGASVSQQAPDIMSNLSISERFQTLLPTWVVDEFPFTQSALERTQFNYCLHHETGRSFILLRLWFTYTEEYTKARYKWQIQTHHSHTAHVVTIMVYRLKKHGQSGMPWPWRFDEFRRGMKNWNASVSTACAQEHANGAKWSFERRTYLSSMHYYRGGWTWVGQKGQGADAIHSQ